MKDAVNKLGTLFSGCLTGMVSLVLIVFIVSFISNYLYNAPFRYKVIDRVAASNGRKYAHRFTNTNSKDSRAPYAGVSLSRNWCLSRNYENEVLVISPAHALTTLELVWIDNLKLEIKFHIDPSVKTYIHYGNPPSNLLRELIFTELPAISEGEQTEEEA